MLHYACKKCNNIKIRPYYVKIYSIVISKQISRIFFVTGVQYCKVF